ncbi:MAG: hypothetical protein ACTIJH_11825 [Moraxellaceae bacterium]
MALNIKETTQKELAGKSPNWAINGIIERYEENRLVDEDFIPDLSHAPHGFLVLTADDCMDKFSLSSNDVDYEPRDDEEGCIAEHIEAELGNKVVAVYDDSIEGKLFLVEDY